MWNPFKKKTAQDAPPVNRVEELANTLQREERIGELEDELKKFDRSTLSQTELESWWHIYGIIAFRAGRNQEATARFEEGYRHFPNSARIRFSLGQQYVTARQLERGFELFRSCSFPGIPREYVMAQVRYAYLWNRYDDAFVMLRPFFKAYQDLKILDDHFLYVRGLPFFGTWWSQMAALGILNGDTRELEHVTAYVTSHCHDYDFEVLNAELAACRDDRPQVMLPFIERTLAAVRPDFPHGYALMKRAVIQGRSAANARDAEAMLDKVELKANDFPWLGDLRTLARAEIHHRFGQSDREAAFVEKFMARQPMLFEPDIALDFHLLRYQERLKPRFQAT